jgi:PAS domain S-box-containing protein
LYLNWPEYELVLLSEHLEDFLMADKPTYEELIKRVKELEKEALERSSLERNLRNFETTVESSINAIGFADLEGKLIYVNDSCVKMWGYNNKGEMLGRFLPEFWEGDGVFRIIKELKEKGIAEGEDVGKRKDGSLLNVLFTASMVKDEAGNPSFMFGSFFDITPRKQFEEALRKSEKVYRILVETIPHGIQEIDTSGFITFANDAYCRLLGYEEEELIGKAIWDFIEFETASEKEGLKEYLKLLIKDQPSSIPYFQKNRKKDGEVIDVQVDWNYKRNEQGLVTGFISVITDITERKRAKQALQKAHAELEHRVEERTAELMKVNKQLQQKIEERKQIEEALKVSENRYRTVVESQTEIICRFLPDGTLTFVNDAYCRYFRKNRGELVGYKFMPRIPESDRDKVFKNISSLNPDNPIITHEHQVFTHNGEICWNKWTNQAIFDDQNNLMEYQAVGWDITKRKKIEEKLLKSEKRFRTLVETMTDGLGIQDKNGLITYVNNKFCQMLGYKPDDFIGRPVSDFLDEKNKRILKNQMSDREKGKAKSYELEWNRKDGDKIPSVMSPQAIFDEKKQFMGSFAVITDISGLKRAKEALRKAHDELEQRVEERTKELENKTERLEEVNAAMKVLLEHSEMYKQELEEKVLSNIKELVDPYLEKLEGGTSDIRKIYLSIIRSNIDEIISPFTRKLSSKYLNLTPSEIRIANLVKQGKTSKEIAGLLNVSGKTVGFHRESIRKKLGLKNKKANLRSHLLSLQ